jgi:hypothetical protein
MAATTVSSLPVMLIGIGEKLANFGKALVSVKDRRIEFKAMNGAINFRAEMSLLVQGG